MSRQQPSTQSALALVCFGSMLAVSAVPVQELLLRGSGCAGSRFGGPGSNGVVDGVDVTLMLKFSFVWVYFTFLCTGSFDIFAEACVRNIDSYS